MFNKCKLYLFLTLFLYCLVPQAKTLPTVLQPYPEAGVSKYEFGIKETTLTPLPDKSNAKLRVGCRPAWYRQVDPLVSPGNPMSAHVHVGFGNNSITENSNLDDLVNIGASSCVGGTAVRSAGWVPAMINMDTKTIVPPLRNLLYYFSGYGDKAFNNINPIPNGLKFLVGDANNSTEIQSIFTKKFAAYSCLNATTQNPRVISYSSIPICNGGELLRITLPFPNCWDGVRLDAPNHKDHIAFFKANWYTFNECPATHPVRLMQVSFNIDYKVPVGETTSNWWLSSDDMETGNRGYSLHGDWVHGDSVNFQNMVVNNLLRNPTPSEGLNGTIGLDPLDGKYKMIYQP